MRLAEPLAEKSRMKKIKILMILFLTVSSTILFSQTLRDGKGIKVGTIENGIVRNGQGQKIASYDEHNIIRDQRGVKTSSIDNGTIRNEKGIKTGVIDQNGTVRNAQGLKIGSIDGKGIVRNGKGMKIGSADGIPIKIVAWFYFFKTNNYE